jgi:predicted pyridoxine 5'-phosphate oxidase superfamily flavin-nucleotide-binding protein
VRHQASRIAGSIHDSVPAVAQAFLEQRRFVVLSTADQLERPWASVLSGAAGFARAADPRTIRIDATPVSGDPLADNLSVSRYVGLLAIDFATRRRLRLNGRLALDRDGAILIQADQVYSNCPKYIPRRHGEEATDQRTAQLVRRLGSLSEGDREWIRRTESFFIATLTPERGADASHRGGPPGFLTVEGERLSWPDYAGNMMFNTLGNIAVHPRAGLVIPNFESGSVLQLTGTAGIDWDAARAGTYLGAQRMVDLVVEEAVELAHVLPVLTPPQEPSRA